MMNRLFHLLLPLLLTTAASAQTAASATDSTLFKGYYYNKEYNVYIQLDLYGQHVTVPGQSIFGELPGYLGDNQDGRKWLFTAARQKGRHAVELEIVNDYGSEDLTATLELQRDGSYKLTQQHGSTMKIARNRKWQKLPSTMLFAKRGTDYEKRQKAAAEEK